jgi:hypothetical protein
MVAYAGVGAQAADDHPVDVVLAQLQVEVGVGESARHPVHRGHDIPFLRLEVGMELAAPASLGEHLRAGARNLHRR